MELSTDQIHTYLHCPSKYKFRYVDGINMPKSKKVIYKIALHKTVDFFFFSILGGWVPSPKQMKDKWASTWTELNEIKTDNLTDLILKPTKITSGGRKVSDPEMISGMEMIHNFYHFNKDNPGLPVGVGLDFRVPIFDNVIVTGKFELVREILDQNDGKRYIEIVDFKTGSESIDPFSIKNDFNLTLTSFAFRNLFQNAEEDRLKYHYLKSGYDVITYRGENDFNRMKATIKGVAVGIENKLFYPRQTPMCRSCEFKDICDRAKF